MNADDFIITGEGIYLLVFFVMIFIIPALVVWATYSERALAKGIDLSALWVHNERLDKFAVIILTTWWVHTSSVVLWTLLKTITTADYTTYQLWALPIMAKMFAPEREQPK